MSAVNGDFLDLMGHWSASRILKKQRNGISFFIGEAAPPVVVHYELAAVDSGSGRRYWTGTDVSFAAAPSPVGVWDTNSLTVLSYW
jgi:hypothetical protein